MGLGRKGDKMAYKNFLCDRFVIHFTLLLFRFYNTENGKTKMAFLKRIWIRVSRCVLDLADQMHTQGTETPT